MNVWFNKYILGILLLFMFCTSAVQAEDRRQELYTQVQKALFYWDVDRAEELSKELIRLDSKSDAVFYLRGVIAFYRGKYPEAKSHFAKVKKLQEFEAKQEGLAYLTEEILKANVRFKEKQNDVVLIRYQAGIDEVMVDLVLEGMTQVRSRLGKFLDFMPEEKIIVEIYPSTDGFIAASPLTEAEVKTSGTIALCKYGRILMTTPRSLLRGYPWMDTLSHEYVHYVITRKWGKWIPVWLHEGMAKYYESLWREDQPDYLSPSYEHLLARAERRNQFVTFSQMHPSFAKLPSSDLAQLAYAQVAAVVEYILQEKGGFKTLAKLLHALSEGQDLQEAFIAVFGVPTEDLLKTWKKWLKKKDFKERKGLDPRSLQFVDAKQAPEEKNLDQMELSQIPTASAREHVHLGDLLRYRGRLRASVAEYQRAQKKAKESSPVIGTKLGLSYQLLKENESAKKVLTEVLNTYPNEGLALRILGDIAFSEKQYANAESFYLRAIYINPFNPYIQANLLEVYKKLKNKKARKRQKQILEVFKKHS